MICAVALPRGACDAASARAWQAFVAPPGVIVCGLPAVLTIAQSPAGPDGEEYVKTRCVLKER
jgi:hypothetical protein